MKEQIPEKQTLPTLNSSSGVQQANQEKVANQKTNTYRYTGFSSAEDLYKWTHPQENHTSQDESQGRTSSPEEVRSVSGCSSVSSLSNVNVYCDQIFIDACPPRTRKGNNTQTKLSETSAPSCDTIQSDSLLLSKHSLPVRSEQAPKPQQAPKAKIAVSQSTPSQDLAKEAVARGTEPASPTAAPRRRDCVPLSEGLAIQKSTKFSEDSSKMPINQQSEPKKSEESPFSLVRNSPEISFANKGSIFSRNLSRSFCQGDLEAPSYNSIFQSLLDISQETREDQVRVFEDIQELLRVFQQHAAKVAQTIIEMTPEERDIISLDKGIAGGQKFLLQGIFFKYARDDKGMYGGDQYAQKVAGHELRSIVELANMRIPDLHLPLACIIDYGGHRLLALSELEIGDSIVYGTENAGKTFHFAENDKPVLSLAKRIGRELNLAPHTFQGKKIYLCADAEIHRARDGRLYLIDGARLWPPIVDSSRPSQKGAVFFNLMRPELLFDSVNSLNPDTFSGFGLKDPKRKKSEKVLEKASKGLTSRHYRELAQDILENYSSNSFSDVTHFFHRNGVNCRDVMKVIPILQEHPKHKFLVLEAYTRSLKTVIKREWRDLAPSASYERGLKFRLWRVLNDAALGHSHQYLPSVVHEMKLQFQVPVTDRAVFVNFIRLHFSMVFSRLQSLLNFSTTEKRHTVMSLLSNQVLFFRSVEIQPRIKSYPFQIKFNIFQIYEERGIQGIEDHILRLEKKIQKKTCPQPEEEAKPEITNTELKATSHNQVDHWHPVVHFSDQANNNNNDQDINDQNVNNQNNDLDHNNWNENDEEDTENEEEEVCVELYLVYEQLAVCCEFAANRQNLLGDQWGERCDYLERAIKNRLQCVKVLKQAEEFESASSMYFKMALVTLKLAQKLEDSDVMQHLDLKSAQLPDCSDLVSRAVDLLLEGLLFCDQQKQPQSESLLGEQDLLSQKEPLNEKGLICKQQEEGTGLTKEAPSHPPCEERFDIQCHCHYQPIFFDTIFLLIEISKDKAMHFADSKGAAIHKTSKKLLFFLHKLLHQYKQADSNQITPDFEKRASRCLLLLGQLEPWFQRLYKQQAKNEPEQEIWEKKYLKLQKENFQSVSFSPELVNAYIKAGYMSWKLRNIESATKNLTRAKQLFSKCALKNSDLISKLQIKSLEFHLFFHRFYQLGWVSNDNVANNNSELSPRLTCALDDILGKEANKDFVLICPDTATPIIELIDEKLPKIEKLLNECREAECTYPIEFFDLSVLALQLILHKFHLSVDWEAQFEEFASKFTTQFAALSQINLDSKDHDISWLLLAIKHRFTMYQEAKKTTTCFGQFYHEQDTSKFIWHKFRISKAVAGFKKNLISINESQSPRMGDSYLKYFDLDTLFQLLVNVNALPKLVGWSQTFLEVQNKDQADFIYLAFPKADLEIFKSQNSFKLLMHLILELNQSGFVFLALDHYPDDWLAIIFSNQLQKKRSEWIKKPHEIEEVYRECVPFGTHKSWLENFGLMPPELVNNQILQSDVSGRKYIAFADVLKIEVFFFGLFLAQYALKVPPQLCVQAIRDKIQKKKQECNLTKLILASLHTNPALRPSMQDIARQLQDSPVSIRDDFKGDSELLRRKYEKKMSVNPQLCSLHQLLSKFKQLFVE